MAEAQLTPIEEGQAIPIAEAAKSLPIGAWLYKGGIWKDIVDPFQPGGKDPQECYDPPVCVGPDWVTYSLWVSASKQLKEHPAPYFYMLELGNINLKFFVNDSPSLLHLLCEFAPLATLMASTHRLRRKHEKWLRKEEKRWRKLQKRQGKKKAKVARPTE